MELAVVGLGYWGPNIVRNGLENQRITTVHAFDINPNRRDFIKKRYRNVEVHDTYDTILKDDRIEGVAIVTPVSKHFELAQKALEAGKHIIVEKPFTATVREADALIDLAEKKGLVILVDHTFIYTSAVRKIKEIIDTGELGDIFYYDSVRVNLGLFQHDINVLWDLAPHDFSIMDYLLGKQPKSVSAIGKAHIDRSGLENIAYVHMNFDDGLTAHFHVNWMSPVKIRKVLIGGSKKMLVFDDMEPAEKVKVYDKGVDIVEKDDVYKTLVQYRSGDIYIPHIENVEALRLMMDDFVNAVQEKKSPLSDAHFGQRVVTLLESAEKSIQSNGSSISL
jgi:predicted dehydrogenase